MRAYTAFLCVVSVVLVWTATSVAGKPKFDRHKPVVGVVTLGYLEGDPVTLSEAVVRVVAGGGGPTLPGAKALARGITINTSHVEYETASRHYTHVDGPGHADYVKNMVTGAAQMDGAVLVVSAVDGPVAQTREHVLLARQVGVPSIVVFLDKSDLVTDPALLDLVELEVRALLGVHGYDGKAVPVVRGSLEAAVAGAPRAEKAIALLLAAMDAFIDAPLPKELQPFLMPVEDVLAIEGRSPVARGRVESGVIHPGDEVEIVGFGSLARSRVGTITPPQAFGKQKARKRDRKRGMSMRGVDADELRPGHVLAEPGTVTAHVEFRAFVVETGKPGSAAGAGIAGTLALGIRTADVVAKLVLPADGTAGGLAGLPTQPVVVHLRLGEPVALEQGQRFAIREGGRTVGAGQVTEILK